MCCEGLDVMLINSDGAMRQRGIPGRTNLQRPLTGRSVVVMLGLFFGAMFIANGALIYIALSTLHGEEMENSYDASQAYNSQIAAARAQAALGWTVDLSTRDEGGGERVVADFRDRSGAAISGLEVRARFVHPFDRTADREAALASDGGAYEGVAGPLHAGRWTLVIEARQNGQVKFTSDNQITLGQTAEGG